MIQSPYVCRGFVNALQHLTLCLFDQTQLIYCFANSHSVKCLGALVKIPVVSFTPNCDNVSEINYDFLKVF